MLIEIDRSMGQFDRALIDLAIDFRSSFSARAGGLGPPVRLLFATAIASMIGTTATAKAAQLRATAVALRAGANDAARRQSM
jgi:hypothetical protein